MCTLEKIFKISKTSHQTDLTVPTTKLCPNAMPLYLLNTSSDGLLPKIYFFPEKPSKLFSDLYN